MYLILGGIVNVLSHFINVPQLFSSRPKQQIDFFRLEQRYGRVSDGAAAELGGLFCTAD